MIFPIREAVKVGRESYDVDVVTKPDTAQFSVYKWLADPERRT